VHDNFRKKFAATHLYMNEYICERRWTTWCCFT